MTRGPDVYRQLQKQMDRQPIGFPRTWSGAEIRFLKHLFTPEDARLALHLDYRPTPLSVILQRVPVGSCPEDVAHQLDTMFRKGAIGCKERQGERRWFLMPVVVGMFEAQAGNLTRRFLTAANAYMRTLSFGRSFLAVNPSQMRTIPVNLSIPVGQPLATYNHIRGLVDACEGPFVVLPCICRKLQGMKQRPCKQTSRTESCLAFGETAAMCLRRGMGREVSRTETLTILDKNQGDGLVLQPSNTQRAEFVCSCCGCCCGMLRVQKMLPRPVDFWTSDFQAAVTPSACRLCGTCVERCQVNAMIRTGPKDTPTVNPDRCIGCGLCVPTCPAKAIRLVRKARATTPPADEEALHEQIKTNKKHTAGQLVVLLKIAATTLPGRNRATRRSSDIAPEANRANGTVTT